MPFVPAQNPQSNWLYYSSYLILSAVGLYYMRIGTVSQLTGTQLEPFFTKPGRFTYPGRPNVIIRRSYTGVPAVDSFLGMLVTAFLAGPAGFQKHIQLQQVNFLFNFAPVLAVMSIEAVRSRRWSLVVFTSLWASLYQTVGGAVVVPLYFLVHSYAFGKPDGSRLVPAAWAKTLLPALGLGYLIPTALMFYPFGNIDYTMLATAFWQPAPILVNIIWVTLRQVSSSAGTATTHIRRALAITGVVAAAAHFGTLYGVFSSSYPTLTPSSIFVPLESRATSFEEAAHFIFQIDYLLIFIGSTIWCLQTRAADRVRGGRSGSRMADLGLLVSSAVALGPGATLAWVWYRRQGRVGIKSE